MQTNGREQQSKCKTKEFHQEIIQKSVGIKNAMHNKVIVKLNNGKYKWVCVEAMIETADNNGKDKVRQNKT